MLAHLVLTTGSENKVGPGLSAEVSKKSSSERLGNFPEVTQKEQSAGVRSNQLNDLGERPLGTELRIRWGWI